ncbi:unnamed protein product [Effrenium voratum]|nr:unnamed protein product [Effrenium voratum]
MARSSRSRSSPPRRRRKRRVRSSPSRSPSRRSPRRSPSRRRQRVRSASRSRSGPGGFGGVAEDAPSRIFVAHGDCAKIIGRKGETRMEIERHSDVRPDNTRKRCCTDQWLDENEREWMCLDALCRSRPWATNKDTPFPYPFKEATDQMRDTEGPWVGDEDPFPRDWTRGPAGHEVLTNLRQVKEHPPPLRLILFTPEFGCVDSFDWSVWGKLCPLDDTDVWVVSWQGWTSWTEMIDQVTRKVLSFADGVSTVWYGHSMGALVAYEVLKRFETRYRSPNLPVALMVSGCPAPHLFREHYRPQVQHSFLEELRISNDFDILRDDRRDVLTRQFQAQFQAGRDLHRKAILNDLKVLQSYLFEHEDDRAVHIPVVAVSHDEDNLVEPSMMEAWEPYTKSFEWVPLEDVADGEILAEQGHGYAMRPVPELLDKIAETMLKYQIPKDLTKILPDIGPSDGPMPAEVDAIVVGAGLAGVTAARAMVEAGRDVLVFDRYAQIGGIWTYYANQFSRVNTSEVGYRLVNQEGPGARPNEDHSPTHDIMRDLFTVAAKFAFGKFRLCTEVVKVDSRPDKSYDVHWKNLTTGESGQTHCKSICFHTNRRIGKRRDVEWPGREKFRGECVYGYANEVLPLTFWGKHVIVVGAGAFAYENLRTAIEHGAKHVTMLGRRAGTTCPKWIDVIAFLRPMDEHYNTGKSGNMISFDAWKKCYEDAGLPTPECWAEGLLKPHNHTISVSDLAFIAGYHGLATLRVGEIKEFRNDGHGVVLKDGSKLDCDIIIKATGFLLNDEVPKISGRRNIHSFDVLDFNMAYGAEPLLDGAQFGSAKGRIAEEEQVSEEALYQGILQMQRTGLPDISQRNNPFGSGYAGPMYVSAWFFKWLVLHPEFQEDLLKACGNPAQDAVRMWASSIGVNRQNITKKLVVDLGAMGASQLTFKTEAANIKIQREEDMDPDKKERWVDIIGNARQRRAALDRILDVANYVRDEDGKVLKDGASVPAPGAGEALILQISCNEVGRVLGRGGETIRRLEERRSVV